MVYDEHIHANSVPDFMLHFFNNYVAKQNGTRSSVLGKIKLLDEIQATFIGINLKLLNYNAGKMSLFGSL
jgi:hypothetical protein